MGNCQSHPRSDQTNICNNAIGETTSSVNFCTLDGSHDNKRRNYCEGIGQNEWVFDSRGDRCHYNDCDEETDFGTGCCNGCCGITGRDAVCRRVAFNGEDLLCCLRDQACKPSISGEFCFDNGDKQRTCKPENRDLTSSACRSRMFDFCTGTGAYAVPKGQSEEWIKRWLGSVNYGGQTFDQPCYHAIYRNLYNNQIGKCLAVPNAGFPDNQGYTWSQDLISAMISRYIQDGGDLNATESSEHNDKLNAMIWSICSKTPGLCSKALYKYCATTTTDTLSRRVTSLPWCGCYMQEEEYSKFTNLYHINRECTPTCNMKGVIPLPSDDGNSTKTCNQSTCIIDDTTIDIAKSAVGNTGTGIEFSQLCSSCSAEGGTGSCNCIITGGTFKIVDSKIGNFQVSQQCTGTSVCYKETKNPDGSLVNTRVPCDSDASYDPYAEIEAQSKKNLSDAISARNLKIAIIFAIVIVVIVILWFIFNPKTDIEKEIRIPRQPLPYTGNRFLGAVSIDPSPVSMTAFLPSSLEPTFRRTSRAPATRVAIPDVSRNNGFIPTIPDSNGWFSNNDPGRR